VPDPQDPATRDESVLDWREPTAPGHIEMLHFYRELIRVRRTQPDVASGDLRATSTAYDEAGGWLIMSRGSVHVVCNLASRSQVVPFDGDVQHVLASWGRAPIVDEHGVWLDGHDVAVVRTT
jgi:maltooligosyltrehalose trehalohydrolase